MHIIRLAALLACAALPALVPAAPALAREAQAPAPAATATRDNSTVVLGWTGLSGPVDIWQLPSPDAAQDKGRKLRSGVAGNSVTLVVEPWPRPYFLVRDAKGHELVVAERLLPLEGGSNFRDLGGYRTVDGAEVAWGKLYRSAVMANLTPDDFQHLGKLGIATVCDFRATDERKRDMVNWPADIQPTILATDYALDMGAMASLFRGGPVTADGVKQAMAGFYREMPFTFADQYAGMMRNLVDGNVPLAFNCSAGKDRTGLAAALILTALGVPAETVMSDYLLSNQTYTPKPPSAGSDDPTARMFASLPADAVQALMGVDRSYLEAAFAGIEAKGGLDRYYAQELKLSKADIETLQKRYLVR